MGGPLSAVFSNIYMTELEKDAIIAARKPKLYNCFVGNIFTRRPKCPWPIVRIP